MTTRHIRWERRGADEHAAASVSDFPYEPRFHDVLGARMAVVDEGGGEQPPLVLLHGNPQPRGGSENLTLTVPGRSGPLCWWFHDAQRRRRRSLLPHLH